MKTLFVSALLAFTFATPALAADACQAHIASMIKADETLGAILEGITASDVSETTREKALWLAEGLGMSDEFEKAFEDKDAKAYQPGFHLLYVAAPRADGTCEILAVGQGD
jgi:hypothetical protein